MYFCRKQLRNPLGHTPTEHCSSGKGDGVGGGGRRAIAILPGQLSALTPWPGQLPACPVTTQNAGGGSSDLGALDPTRWAELHPLLQDVPGKGPLVTGAEGRIPGSDSQPQPKWLHSASANCTLFRILVPVFLPVSTAYPTSSLKPSLVAPLTLHSLRCVCTEGYFYHHTHIGLSGQNM